MFAIRLHEFGSLDHVQWNQVPDLTAQPGRVLVRMKASGVNPVDWKVALAYFRPPVDLPFTLGWDAAGVVEVVGAGVTKFRPGDRVIAYPQFLRAACHASLAEFAPEEVAPLADSLSFAQGAGLPVSGLTAMQALFSPGREVAGKRVLVHAAAGGVGAMALQLAKQAGAWAIGTASAGKLDLLRELGADEAVDYRARPFEEQIEPVDLVFDAVGGETQIRSLGLLKTGGHLASIVQPPDAAALAARGLSGGMTGVTPDEASLSRLANMAADGSLKVVLDREFSAAEFRAAWEYSMTGRATGKIVLRWD
jgi:NADPH:quinone reductase-like Zn-dependent oxidoreductase